MWELEATLRRAPRSARYISHPGNQDLSGSSVSAKKAAAPAAPSNNEAGASARSASFWACFPVHCVAVQVQFESKR
jgi:hypothetical protein